MFMMIFGLGLSISVMATTIKERQSLLKSLQTQIDRQHSQVSDTQKQHQQLLQLLKSDEQAIANVATQVNQSQKQQQQLNDSLAELSDKQKQLQHQQQAQQQALANQLKSAYLSGSHDYTKMLLSQQDPASVERLLTYYQYLNKARVKAIAELKTTLSELKQTQNQIVEQKQQLAKVTEQQQRQAEQLEKESEQRQLTLTQLQRVLNRRGARLEQLQIEEASLKQAIDQAIRESKQQYSLVGLSAQRGKLKWPIQGRLTHSFGSPRGGQLRWRGVLLSAPEGRAIKAIATGKVIFADWLKGFGMVIVVDHGKGYMSLYGHAQALLKSSGDRVKQGETLALVGRSGGQAEPGLYFEIRHKGKAINPSRYCKR
ncbi:peptidase M23 [Parashewanella curva]|uniref:Peptidase M23 n=1 Tax=Parashewanella curva TaxID=2338552 RepID=A0A3L8PVY9_9GAMM|nr:peptidoglycan DD-metalloendopeptidase family protein [Parashewanella curva]RLV58753.1 peptidase M23 [Parashewanella curva]